MICSQWSSWHWSQIQECTLPFSGIQTAQYLVVFLVLILKQFNSQSQQYPHALLYVIEVTVSLPLPFFLIPMFFLSLLESDALKVPLEFWCLYLWHLKNNFYMMPTMMATAPFLAIYTWFSLCWIWSKIASPQHLMTLDFNALRIQWITHSTSGSKSSKRVCYQYRLAR